MTSTTVPTNLDEITGHQADELFLVAIDGADAENVEHVGSFRDPATGFTWTRTTGRYGDGQTCDGWHVRDTDGEFIDFIAA